VAGGNAVQAALVASSGTLQFCVALNPNIYATSDVGRVVGYDAIAAQRANNSGRVDMRLNTTLPSWTNIGADALDGASIDSTNWGSADWWTGKAGFSTAFWDIVNGKLPTLKGMPKGAGEQKPVIQNN